MKVLFVPPLGAAYDYAEVTEKIGEPTTCTVTFAGGTSKTYTGVTVKHGKDPDGEPLLLINIHGHHPNPDSLGEGTHVVKGSMTDVETVGMQGYSTPYAVLDEIADFEPNPVTSWATASSEDILKSTLAAKQAVQYKPPEAIVTPAMQAAIDKIAPGMKQFAKSSGEAAQSLKHLAAEQMAAHQPAQPPEPPAEPLTVSPDLFATPEEDEAWAKAQQEPEPPKYVSGGIVHGGPITGTFKGHHPALQQVPKASAGTHTGIDKGSITISAKGLTLMKLDAQGNPIPGSESTISPKFAQIVGDAPIESAQQFMPDYSATDIEATEQLAKWKMPKTMSINLPPLAEHTKHILFGEQPLTCGECHPLATTEFEQAVEEHAPDYEAKAHPHGTGIDPALQKAFMFQALYGGVPNKFKDLYYGQQIEDPPYEQQLHEVHPDGTYSTPNPPVLFGVTGQLTDIPVGFTQPGTHGSQSTWWRFVYSTQPYYEQMKHDDIAHWANSLPIVKTVVAAGKEAWKEHDEFEPFSDYHVKSNPPSLVYSASLKNLKDPAAWQYIIELPEMSLHQIGKHLGVIP